MPFWTDLTGADEVLSDAAALTPQNKAASKDIARLHARGKAWGVNDLAKALSGDDPMAQIGNLVADYWARRWQALLISTMINVILNENLADNEFINTRTENFEQMKETVLKYTPEYSEKITKVPAEKIREAARIIAKSCFIIGMVWLLLFSSLLSRAFFPSFKIILTDFHKFPETRTIISFL